MGVYLYLSRLFLLAQFSSTRTRIALLSVENTEFRARSVILVYVVRIFARDHVDKLCSHMASLESHGAVAAWRNTRELEKYIMLLQAHGC